MGIRYERGVLVTPATAANWLRRNSENNRAAKSAKIPMYARDIVLNRWLSDTGETIKFTGDSPNTGQLIDGQNRLRAVELAGSGIDVDGVRLSLPEGAGVVFDIAYNVPVEAMQVIDTGASRTAADVLKIAGARERMRSAAIVRWAIMWEHGQRASQGGSFAPTTTDIAYRYLAEPEAFDAATARGSDVQRAGLGTGAAAGTAFYMFAKLDRELAHQFFDQLLTGANLPDRHAVLILRNKLARMRVDRLTRAEQLAWIIKAWNHMRDGKSTSTFYFREAITNENFPEPK